MKEDFNFYDESKVYTSAIDLYGIDNFVPYTELPENFVSWIENTSIELINKSTMAEIKLKSIMSQSNTPIVEQVFFYINGKSYFVDFFLPAYKIIVEIDGGSHWKKEFEDLKRDKMFTNLGLRVIRITNNDVYREDFKKFFSELVFDKQKSEEYAIDYILTPKDNKFKGVMTVNQKLLYKCISIFKEAKKESSILIRTDVSYLVFTLYRNEDRDKYCENKAFLDEIRDVIRDRSLDIHVSFIGKRENINHYLAKIVRETDKYNRNNNFDLCIDLKGIDVNYEIKL